MTNSMFDEEQDALDTIIRNAETARQYLSGCYLPERRQQLDKIIESTRELQTMMFSYNSLLMDSEDDDEAYGWSHQVW